jgi:hypothetical protein
MLYATHAHAAGAASQQAADDESWFSDNRGHRHSFRAVYDPWFGPLRGDAHPRRAAVEVAALTLAQLAFYWLNHDANKEDWDDPSLVDKLTLDAACFDNNPFDINFLLHPSAGAAFYGVSRSNNLSVPVSFAYTVAGSAVWEFFLEAREQVSFNDLVFTPFGGMPIGEFFFHLSDYVNSAPDGGHFPQDAAAYTLGIVHKAHDGIDGRGPARPTLPADALGFSSAYAHRFGIGYGFAAIENDEERVSSLHELELSATLVAMPGFLRMGRFDTFFQHGNFSEARVRLGFSEGELGETDLWFSSVLAGWYGQRFERSPSGLAGRAVMVGANSAFRYYDLRVLGRRDRFAIAHMLGPAADLWMKQGDFAAHVNVGASVDFAGIRPLAYEPWTERFGKQGTKSVLQQEGYSIAWGASGRLRASATYALAEVGGAASFGRYGSIEGHDREQSEVTRDIHTTDDIESEAVWVAVNPPAPIRGQLSYERLGRAGSMGSTSVSRFDERLMLLGEYVF